MIMVGVAVLALLLVPLVGGQWKRLGHVHFRGVWVLMLGLVIQVAILAVFRAESATAKAWFAAVHLASYLLAAVFVLLNRRIPGVLLVGAGGLCNGVTIALNRGTLPASPAALQRAGIAPTTSEFSNSAAVHNPVLPWLGDVFAIPAGWPLANVFSVGDVLIWVGIVVAVSGICVPPQRQPWRRWAGRRVQRGYQLPPVTGQAVRATGQAAGQAAGQDGAQQRPHQTSSGPAGVHPNSPHHNTPTTAL